MSAQPNYYYNQGEALGSALGRAILDDPEMRAMQHKQQRREALIQARIN